MITFGILLAIAYIFVFARTYMGTKSRFVLVLSSLYMISNLTFAASVINFNHFQEKVLAADFDSAITWSYYFNVTMGTFVCTLDLAHWIFFFTYFECALTMKYVLDRKPVPQNLKTGLLFLNGIGIIC